MDCKAPKSKSEANAASGEDREARPCQPAQGAPPDAQPAGTPFNQLAPTAQAAPQTTAPRDVPPHMRTAPPVNIGRHGGLPATASAQPQRLSGATAARFGTILAKARQAMLPLQHLIPVTQPDGTPTTLAVTRTGVGPLETKWGPFYLIEFRVNDEWSSYLALVRFPLDSHLFPILPKNGLTPLRIDSGCCTGETFHDLSCDCREQLDYAMRVMAKCNRGILISIPAQDGRGKSLAFKLSSLQLQSELGWNTVQAARFLANGTDIDARNYSGAASVLAFLGCKPTTNFLLLTGNPDKERALRQNGFRCVTQPPDVQVTSHTRRHLQAKMSILGHQVPGLHR